MQQSFIYISSLNKSMTDRYCLNCNHKFFYSGARTCPNCGTRSSRQIAQVVPQVTPVPEVVQLPQLVPVPQVIQELSRFEQFAKQHELSAKVSNDLQRVLSTCEIVLLCDDSGSMSSQICEPGYQSPNAKKITRWFELKKLAAALIEISTCVNPNGLDLYFLNRDKQLGINSMAGLSPIFANEPKGSTGITAKLIQIYNDKKALLVNGKQLLIIVISDGEPTDSTGNPRKNLFNAISKLTQTGNVHISFAECTDREEDMAYLDSWDNQIKNFDNTDDYREELKRVKLANGQSFKFDYTDYVIKIMLATFIKSYFNLDQSSTNRSAYAYY